MTRPSPEAAPPLVPAPVTAVYRLAFAALVIAAMTAQFGVTLEKHFSVVNYFSYFTNLSNLIGAVVFVIGAVRVLRGAPDSRGWSIVRFCSTLDMVFVGIVFNVLLTADAVGVVIPWVNVTLHMLFPVVVLIDWILDPPVRPLRWPTALIALIFPVVYSVYSLIRGPITGFYPYPFYNADKLGGYGPLTLYLLVLIVALVVLSLLLHWLGQWVAGRRRSVAAV